MRNNERYIRQMILTGFGKPGQDALQQAKILIVGMGGLGCPALQYLVGAGVGNIGIMDPDTISLSNLHRQLLYGESDIGTKKVEVAFSKMNQLNPDVMIDAYPFALTNKNATNIIQQYDLVLDATDNFPAKYIINDACVILHKPFVYGAVTRYEGQLSLFNIPQPNSRSLNYRDLFPVMPLPGEILTCEEAGVLGVLPGIIGTMQAAEAIKYFTGLGQTLYGRLFTYNLLTTRSFEIALNINDNTTLIDKPSFELEDYEFSSHSMEDIPEISVAEFNVLTLQPNVFILDVRERHEYPPIDFADAQIPMSELASAINGLPNKEICVICHQGIRSVYAAELIKAQRNLTVYSLKGGLTAYFNQQIV